MEQFLWTPGNGVDPFALGRLRAHFPRPTEPMGEAWFMGDERRMFRELLGSLDAITTRDLQEPLAEISTGTGSFGPMKEWNTWYHYLLGALLPRNHESFVSYLLESLLTGFMAIYPNGIYREPYKGFREDVLLTLGRCMMDSMCWNGSDIAIGKVLRQSNNNPNHVWVWWDASGDFTASMFFCMKYLPESSVAVAAFRVRYPFTALARTSHRLVGRRAWDSEQRHTVAIRIFDGGSTIHWLGVVALSQGRDGRCRRQWRAACADIHPGGCSNLCIARGSVVF